MNRSLKLAILVILIKMSALLYVCRSNCNGQGLDAGISDSKAILEKLQGQTLDILFSTVVYARTERMPRPEDSPLFLDQDRIEEIDRYVFDDNIKTPSRITKYNWMKDRVYAIDYEVDNSRDRIEIVAMTIYDINKRCIIYHESSRHPQIDPHFILSWEYCGLLPLQFMCLETHDFSPEKNHLTTCKVEMENNKIKSLIVSESSGLGFSSNETNQYNFSFILNENKLEIHAVRDSGHILEFEGVYRASDKVYEYSVYAYNDNGHGAALKKQYTYDAKGNPLEYSSFDSGGGKFQVKYKYDENGMISSIIQYNTSLNPKGESEITNFVVNEGRVVQTDTLRRSSRANEPETIQESTYKYLPSK